MNHGVYLKDFSREDGDRRVCLARLFVSLIRSLSLSLCCVFISSVQECYSFQFSFLTKEAFHGMIGFRGRGLDYTEERYLCVT